MTFAWFAFSLLAPPAAAAACFAFFRSEDAEPALIVVFNAIMPGSGLAAAGRPVIEVVLGVVLAQVSLLMAGGPFLEYLGPIAVIGAVWGVIHTEWNPLKMQGQPAFSPADDGGLQPPTGSEKPAAPSPYDTVGGMVQHGEETADAGGEGYSVAVRCTECGADVDVPVLHHAARCPFCGSHHLVVGQDSILQVAIPDMVRTEDGLRDAVLDHFRYLYYIKLYQKSVAPLERQATGVGPTGGLVAHGDLAAAAEAAERAVSLKADRHREKLASELQILRSQHFYSPYRHAVGTLYQAAFGRDRNTQDKILGFSMGTLETAVTAQRTFELPQMGKLSYLKTLVPVAQLAEEVRSLEFDLEPSALEAARGDLSRKQLDRSIQTIKLGSTFHEDAHAVVWRPWWIAEVKASGIHEVLLVDGGGGSVAGNTSFVPSDLLVDLPPEGRAAGASLRFQPMECPTCGHEFRYDVDAALHFCINCHRLFEANEGGKKEIAYHHVAAPEKGDADFVPFWVFRLRLTTASGFEITDFRHLRDGIDGTLDQIGEEAEMGQDLLWVPAIRCINARLMEAAFNRLFFHVLRHPPKVNKGRFPLEVKPRPWPICLEEDEVRSFAALYLANAFGRRDMARVKIHQVEDWLFSGSIRSRGILIYAPVPRGVTESFRPYVGRYAGKALAAATGR